MLIGEHHQRITALLDEAAAALESDRPERSRTMATIRWQLVRRLRSYQLFKHTELFDPICRSGGGDKAITAAAMKARCIAIGDEYDRHVKKWSAGDIDSGWASYEHETRAIIVRIRRHLMRENTEAHTLLAGSIFPLSRARGET